MVLGLLPLVKRAAQQMRDHLPANVEVGDLVGAGVLGLIDAIQKFDASKQVKIESYARYRIRGAILDGLRSLDHASRDLRKKNKQAEKAYREMEAKLGRPVGDAEMAEALGVSLNQWYRTVRELQAVGVDWLRPMGSAGLKQLGPPTPIADPTDDPFQRCLRQERREILARAMTGLLQRERLIMWLYYDRELTMKEIGARLGIDESRVSQLHSATLRRLRASLRTILHPPQSPGPQLTAVPSSE